MLHTMSNLLFLLFSIYMCVFPIIIIFHGFKDFAKKNTSEVKKKLIILLIFILYLLSVLQSYQNAWYEPFNNFRYFDIIYYIGVSSVLFLINAICVIIILYLCFMRMLPKKFILSILIFLCNFYLIIETINSYFSDVFNLMIIK